VIRKTSRVFWVLSGLLVLVILSFQTVEARQVKPSWQPEVIVTIASGRIKGFESSPDTLCWKAIPYARPPVGELRWKAPVSPDPWTGIKETLSFCDKCPQFTYNGVVSGSEDCLYLNIWRPKSTQGGLPVYFWIHGGGNSIMTASSASYDGVKLASKTSMVVVTINYRLGPMGWFSHPFLKSGHNALDDSGNYGTLDIIKALAWVRDNIAAFGGDPGNVTVAGESAGAVDTWTMVLSPLASGLFHRAVIESGGVRLSSPAEGESHVNGVLDMLLIKDGQAADQAAARALREKMPAAELEKYLRAKTPEEIIQAHDVSFKPMLKFPNCFTDGTVLPSEGADALKNPSKYNQVPLILGTNKEEAKLFMRQLSGQLSPEEYQKRAMTASNEWKRRGVDEPAATIAAHPTQPPVYAYQFNYGAYNPGGYNAWPIDDKGINYALQIGAAHGLEIPFFWGNFYFFGLEKKLFREDNRAGYEQLSQIMMTFLAQFAGTGRPGQAGGVPWQPWSNAAGGPKRLLLDTDNSGAVIEMSGN